MLFFVPFYATVMKSMQQPQRYWFIFQNNNLLLLKQNNNLPGDAECASLVPHFLRHFQLGQFNNNDYSCAETSKKCVISEQFYTLPLKQALPLFSEDMYSLTVKAFSVINWDRNHRFCSSCGSQTAHRANTFERLCSSCELSFFPRISPSIIVLIKKEDHLLMARSPHYASGVYGLIAGFVEAGERIEETVHREVQEEIGIKIKNLSYFGSQSWPFPDSLMLAFTADYDSGEIVIDQKEIEAAGWYKYNKLPGLPSTSVSIAMKLINHFIQINAS